MKLEVRIPISPGPSWFNKVRLIVASIREFYPDTIFRVSVSPDKEAYPPDLPNVIWNVIDRKEFDRWRNTRYPYIATVLDKYKPPFNADYLLTLDADVLCIRQFDELFKEQGICGMMTHIPPWGPSDWDRLFRMFDVGPLFLIEHSGWGTMVHEERLRYSPNGYFNAGMLFGPKWAWEKFAEHCFEAIDFLDRTLADSYWFDQAMLPLAIAKAKVPAIALSQRWNFPNQKDFDELHPKELEDVRFLHYMRTNIIDRDRDMMDRTAMEKLVARTDLNGSNEIFRKRLEELLPRIT